MRIVDGCGGCCEYVHPDFGGCDGGMIYGAVWDEELNRWVDQDYGCKACNGTGHTGSCLDRHQR